jgi:hypothetical protein
MFHSRPANGSNKVAKKDPQEENVHRLIVGFGRWPMGRKFHSDCFAAKE